MKEDKNMFDDLLLHVPYMCTRRWCTQTTSPLNCYSSKGAVLHFSHFLQRSNPILICIKISI